MPKVEEVAKAEDEEKKEGEAAKPAQVEVQEPETIQAPAKANKLSEA